MSTMPRPPGHQDTTSRPPGYDRETTRPPRQHKKPPQDNLKPPEHLPPSTSISRTAARRTAKMLRPKYKRHPGGNASGPFFPSTAAIQGFGNKRTGPCIMTIDVLPLATTTSKKAFGTWQCRGDYHHKPKTLDCESKPPLGLRASKSLANPSH